MPSARKRRDHRGARRAKLLAIDAQHEEVVSVSGAEVGALLADGGPAGSRAVRARYWPLASRVLV